MKIQPEHFDIISTAINQVRIDYPDATLANYIKHEIGKDCSMRWRWDLFNAAKKYLPDHFVCDVLYEYMNDTHIDTALRHITSTPN